MEKCFDKEQKHEAGQDNYEGMEGIFNYLCTVSSCNCNLVSSKLKII